MIDIDQHRIHTYCTFLEQVYAMISATELCILGCGSSAGVPLVGHQWGDCDPECHKNRRTRCGALVRFGQENWLIDVTPDFRQQALREKIDRIDGVILTHAHFDHIGGLDDLKPFAVAQDRPIPVLMDQTTWDIIHIRYPYACDSGENLPYAPFLSPRLITDSFFAANAHVKPFAQDHGYSTSLGFRFSNWAYSTDVKALDDYAMACLSDLDVWFVDCMGMHPKGTHAHWDITMDWIDRLKPKKAVLIHMGTEMDYDTLCAKLPQHIIPAYDGMRILL